MSSDQQEEKRQIFEKRGIRYNGFRIPYPFVGAFVLVISSTAVALYQIQQFQAWKDKREPKIVELDRQLSVMETRLDNLEYVQRRRYRE